MATVSRSRVLLWTALTVYSAALAVALLAPSSGTQSHMAGWLSELGIDLGISPLRATQARAEFLGNVLILAPISALGSLVWRRTTWRGWTAYAFVIACGVEVTQGLLLANRTPSTTDVVANTLGGLLGAAVVGLLRAALRPLAVSRMRGVSAEGRAQAGSHRTDRTSRIRPSASPRDAEERPGLG